MPFFRLLPVHMSILFTYRTGYDVCNFVIIRWRTGLQLNTRLLLQDLRKRINLWHTRSDPNWGTMASGVAIGSAGCAAHKPSPGIQGPQPPGS